MKIAVVDWGRGRTKERRTKDHGNRLPGEPPCLPVTRPNISKLCCEGQATPAHEARAGDPGQVRVALEAEKQEPASPQEWGTHAPLRGTDLEAGRPGHPPRATRVGKDRVRIF